MNCSNCGKPLLAGSTICPVCGTDNSANSGIQVNATPAEIQTGTTQVNQTPVLQENPPTVPSNQATDNNQVLETPNMEVASVNQVQSLEAPISEVTEVQKSVLNNPPTNAETITANVENTEVNTEEIDDSHFIELDDEEENVEITENMAPPTLNVEEENLTQGAGDLTNEESVSTYSEEAEQALESQEKDKQTRQEERVDIAIPSVGAVTEVSMPSDGSAPEINESSTTVGENTSGGTDLEDPSKKKKFKITFTKGSKNVPKTLMIVVAIIFFVIGILIGKALFSKNYCSTNTGGNKSVISSKKIKYVSDGKNNTTNVGNYTYKIPEQYNYDKREGGVLVYGEDDLFRIYIKVIDGLYSDLSGAKNSIRASMQENQINVSNVKELKANDKEFLVFEVTTRLNNRMITFSDASNDQIFYIEIIDANNSYDYDILDIASDIIKNVTYEEVVSNMEKVDITDISDVAVKAALEYKNLNKNK